MEHALSIGARLKILRRARGLTAMELAKRAGVSEDAVRKVESGRSKQPSFETGVRMAQALGIDAAELALGKSTTPGNDLLARAIQTLRNQKTELINNGIEHAAVFGSVARGEARNDSDVDVLVETQSGKPFSYITMSKVALMLEDILGRPVDIVTRPSITERVQSILKEAVDAF